MNTVDTSAAATQKELFTVGLSRTAYVKAVEDNGETVWSIHQADGTQIGAAPSRDLAFAAIRQHELEPASVH